jgi:glyoxylase-like metal-dependent hydrolase (beta-lactamase superfamily II)
MSGWFRKLLPLSVAFFMALSTVAHAQAPQARTQVPGYYRMALGDFEVTALFDGEVPLEAKMLTNGKSADIFKLLSKAFRGDPTPTAVNAYLINTGKQLILIDAGAGDYFGPKVGHMIRNLKAAGYAPEQVNTILLTHLHVDHIGPLRNMDGEAVFPNAQVHAPKLDADFWLHRENTSKVPETMRVYFVMAEDCLAPYINAGKFHTFGEGAEVVPGIKAVSAHGHTPGHSGYMVESKGKKLYIWGDVVHSASVQFAQPKVGIEFDVDQKKALATRLEVFKRTAKEGTLVAGAHLPFPGIGHVRDEGRGAYAWVPIDFAPMPPVPSAAPAASSPAKP